ncbi:hypothetical protein NQ314_000829 [Rhamnusium bicolor]|uniref:Uncharacterized protein n=1 Tax=Rhamnusium bicolor TaxID=1586634 RepID=A0AAV8ZWZ0_9CUCU|nr:hypothetical protein NQ314_000829 [Rhamnusium bicolor]
MASNDDGSTDDENKVFFRKESCYESLPTCPTCPVCFSAFSKCICNVTNSSFHEEISNGTSIVDDLDSVYNTNNTFLLNLQKTPVGYDSKNYVAHNINHDVNNIETNPKGTEESVNCLDGIKSVNFNGDKLCLCSNQTEERFYEAVSKSDAAVKKFGEHNISDNCENIKSENILNNTDNKENYANDSSENIVSQQSHNDYISTSTSRSKIGCDSTCNIGAVKSPIDSTSDSENQELSPDRGLQNSNGIDLLTAIEEQSNANLKNLERHTSSSAESGNLSSKEVSCSPRKGRTRSVDVVTRITRRAKRAHSADPHHSDVKVRKIDFKQYKKEKKTSSSSSKPHKHREERKHSFSKSKHESKSKSYTKKSEGSHSNTSKEASRHSSYRGDCKPRLLTNGNYSYPPEDKSLKYRRFYHIETHTNGGAKILRMYHDEIKHLSTSETKELALEFFKLAFEEDKEGHAIFVLAVVHGSATYLPDILTYMADNYPTLTVKNGLLSKSSDIETTTLSSYTENVCKHYEAGTVRYGPLHQISIVGTAHEEVGGYFPDLLALLEENQFLELVCSLTLRILAMILFIFSASDYALGGVVDIRPNETY